MVYRAAITGIHADAAGDDRRNRNGEYSLVRNTGTATLIDPHNIAVSQVQHETVAHLWCILLG